MYSVDWSARIARTLHEAAAPLRTEQVAIRCGCLTADDYARLRHALRRLLAQGHLVQDARGYALDPDVRLTP